MLAAQFLPGIGAKLCSLRHKPSGTEGHLLVVNDDALWSPSVEIAVLLDGRIPAIGAVVFAANNLRL